MQIGRFKIEQLSEGFFELHKNGDLQKIHPERLKNFREEDPLGKQSTAIGIDPLLITDGQVNILLDTGLGWGLDRNSHYKDTSNVVTNLSIFGLKPSDIHFVVLTHLHYDHAAGATYVDSGFQTTATFPNAQYILRKNEWTYALEKSQSGTQSPGAGYRLDEMYKLAAENRLHFIEKERYHLVPGIDLLLSGGHTPGHQVVRISNKNKTAFYLGDLIPTEYHLNHYAMKQMDEDPLQAKKFKTLLLKEAFNSGAILFFYHSLYRKSGKLARDERKKYVLLEE